MYTRWRCTESTVKKRMEIKFEVPGEPKGKGRPRFSKVGNYVKARTPQDTVVYENFVKLQYQEQTKNRRFPDDAILDMRIIAYYSIPKSASKKKREQMLAGMLRPSKKPDMDNVVKVIADSLNGIAYRDDTQIVDCQVRKFYSDTPKVMVQIREILKGVTV